MCFSIPSWEFYQSRTSEISFGSLGCQSTYHCAMRSPRTFDSIQLCTLGKALSCVHGRWCRISYTSPDDHWLLKGGRLGQFDLKVQWEESADLDWKLEYGYWNEIKPSGRFGVGIFIPSQSCSMSSTTICWYDWSCSPFGSFGPGVIYVMRRFLTRYLVFKRK